MKSRMSSTIWTLALVNGIALFAVLWLAYSAGRQSGGASMLDFGALRLSQSGLSSGGQRLPWREVQKIESNAAQLSVSKKKKWGHWANVADSEIPNFHVLKALLEQAIPVVTAFKR